MYSSGINVLDFFLLYCNLLYFILTLNLPDIALLNCNYQIDNIFNMSNKNTHLFTAFGINL